MAALPALITAATIAYTVFFPNEKKSSNESSSALQQQSSSSASFSSTSFLMGISVGMSVSWLISYEVKRRRLWEEVRLKLLSWLYDGTSNYHNIDGNDVGEEATSSRLVDKFRKPTKITDLQGTPIPRVDTSDDENDFCGKHLEFLSPNWTLSSNLYVDVLTLPSGSELVPNKAAGVEFYYVVKGNGKYSYNGDTYGISAGYGFIADPGSMRGFLVKGLSSLVILRATDSNVYNGQNMSRIQNSSLVSVVSLANAGLQKLQRLVEASDTSHDDIDQ